MDLHFLPTEQYPINLFLDSHSFECYWILMNYGDIYLCMYLVAETQFHLIIISFFLKTRLHAWKTRKYAFEYLWQRKFRVWSSEVMTSLQPTILYGVVSHKTTIWTHTLSLKTLVFNARSKLKLLSLDINIYGIWMAEKGTGDATYVQVNYSTFHFPLTF